MQYAVNSMPYAVFSPEVSGLATSLPAGIAGH
jgi:hypothetical protein